MGKNFAWLTRAPMIFTADTQNSGLGLPVKKRGDTE